MSEEHGGVFFRDRLAREPWEYMELFHSSAKQLSDIKENFFTRS